MKTITDVMITNHNLMALFWRNDAIDIDWLKIYAMREVGETPGNEKLRHRAKQVITCIFSFMLHIHLIFSRLKSCALVNSIEICLTGNMFQLHVGRSQIDQFQLLLITSMIETDKASIYFLGLIHASYLCYPALYGVTSFVRCYAVMPFLIASVYPCLHFSSSI